MPSSAGSLRLNNAVANTTAVTLTKTGGGRLTLGGTADNAYLGMAINGGTVVLIKTSSASVHGLGAASSVASGATLQLSGTGNYDLYSGCILTVNSGGLFDLGGQSAETLPLTPPPTAAQLWPFHRAIPRAATPPAVWK